MTSRLKALATAESDILKRMAETRAGLVTAREVARLGATGPSLVSHVRKIISTAPNVTLLAALLVGSFLIGPRRIVSVVVRNGLTAWIAKSVRRIAGR